MAQQRKVIYASGYTVYITLSRYGEFYNFDTGLAEAESDGNWTHYARLATALGTSGEYEYTLPDNLPAGIWVETARVRATGTALITDEKIGSCEYYSSGAGSVSVLNARLDLTQLVGTGHTVGTVGEALEAARAQGKGKWVVDRTAKTLTLYKSDGTTALIVFDLAPNANSPISRTPQ